MRHGIAGKSYIDFNTYHACVSVHHPVHFRDLLLMLADFKGESQLYDCHALGHAFPPYCLFRLLHHYYSVRHDQQTVSASSNHRRRALPCPLPQGGTRPSASSPRPRSLKMRDSHPSNLQNGNRRSRARSLPLPLALGYIARMRVGVLP